MDVRYVAGGIALTAVGVITLVVTWMPVFCWGALIFGPILIVQGLRAPDPNAPQAPAGFLYQPAYAPPPPGYYAQPPPPPAPPGAYRPTPPPPPPPPPAANRAACPRCSRPVNWDPRSNRWWCMTCQTYL